MEKTKEEIKKLLKKFIEDYEKTIFKTFESNWDFFEEIYLEAAHFWSDISLSREPGNWKWEDVRWFEKDGDVGKVLRITTIYKITVRTYQHDGIFGYSYENTRSLYLRSPSEQLSLILSFYEGCRTHKRTNRRI